MNKKKLNILPQSSREFIAFHLFPSSIEKVSKIPSPVLIIHGTEDEVIDFSHGLALFERCPKAVEPLWVEGAGHNDIELYSQYLERLRRFINQDLAAQHAWETNNSLSAFVWMALCVRVCVCVWYNQVRMPACYVCMDDRLTLDRCVIFLSHLCVFEAAHFWVIFQHDTCFNNFLFQRVTTVFTTSSAAPTRVVAFYKKQLTLELTSRHFFERGGKVLNSQLFKCFSHMN